MFIADCPRTVRTKRSADSPRIGCGSLRGDDELITPVQVKRLIAAGFQAFTVNVTEDPLLTSDVRDEIASAHGDEEADAPTSGRLTSEQIDVLGTVRPDIKELMLKHAGVFATPHGLTPDRGVDHVIKEYRGSKPVYRPSRRVCPSKAREVQARVEQLLLNGFIEPSNSPYGSPILFVPKKDGMLRICIDTQWRRAWRPGSPGLWSLVWAPFGVPSARGPCTRM
eukprot:221513-Chlamydomonas_euryale.AAC.1